MSVAELQQGAGTAVSARGFSRFIRLGRPKFLFYSALMQGIGVATVQHLTGRASLARFAVWVGFAWLLHLSTHYANEYFDLEADLANTTFTSWTGGSRVLVNREVSPRTSLAIAMLLSGLYAGGLLLLANVLPDALGPRPWLLVGAGLAALALSWSYSAPPIRLTARGLGETTVATVLCIMLPSGAAILQVGYVPSLILWLAIPLYLLQFARMMIMNIPDARSDARTGKRTLVVRLGPKVTLVTHNALQLAGYGLVPILWMVGKYPTPAALLLLLTAPLGALQALRMARGDARDPQSFQRLASTALWHVVSTALAVLVGVLIT